jgi:hypothetical protein
MAVRRWATCGFALALVLTMLLAAQSAAAGNVVRLEDVTFTLPNNCNGDTMTVTADLIERSNNGSTSVVMANAKAVGITGVTYVVTYNYFPSVYGSFRTFTLVQNFIGSDGSHAQERDLFIFGLPGGVDRVTISQTCK